MNDLAAGWANAVGTELFELIRGVTYDKTTVRAEAAPSLVPVLRANNIVAGNLTRTDLVYVPERFVSAHQMLVSGDMVIASSSGSKSVVGKAAPATSALADASFGAFCAVARPRREELADWLRYYFKTNAYRTFVESVALGININNLRSRDLEQVRITLPPLSEQRRIVAKLDALTARTARARADLDRVPVLAEKQRRAILGRFFAKGWSEVALGDIATDVRYGTAAKCSYEPKATPVLRIPNIANGRVDATDLKFASFTAKEIAKLELCVGDMLVIRSNGSVGLVGRTALVDAKSAGMLFAGYLIRIRANDRIDPEYLNLVMQAAPTRDAIESAAKSSSGVHNINSEELCRLAIPLPSLDAQVAAVREASAAFAAIDRLVADAVAARRLLDRLDQAILAKAFRGELVPQDPTDEPASVLLDSIRAERAAATPAKAKRGRMPIPA